MSNFLRTVNNLLSHKRASFYIIVLCILSKSVLISFYSYTGKDKIYSLSASYNLLHGKGWTNSFFYLNDLDTEVLEPFCFWPPGYGLLITPFQFFFGTDIFLATTFFEICCFIIFILLCRAILKTQGLSRSWLNISTVLLAFSSHDFIEASLGTDLLALDFILSFFYAAIRIWSNTDRQSAGKFGVVAGLCLFLAGFTRYVYVPVSLFTIVVLLVLSFVKKNKWAVRGYLVSSIICFAGLLVAMIFQQNLCGSPFYTGVDTKGFFPAHLSYWHPAVIAAFVDLNLVPVQLGKYTAVSYSSWMQLFSWVNLMLYVTILIVACNFFYKKLRSQKGDLPVFIAGGFVLSAAIVGGLALLSLTHDVKYTLSGNAWSFIMEGRYHAFPVLFIQLLALTIIAKKNDLLRLKGFPLIIISIPFFLLLLNSVHQVYYTIKVASHYNTMKKAAVREQDYVYFESLLKQTIKDNPGKEIVVASSDKYYPLLASMHTQKGIGNPYDLDRQFPIVKKPTVLFTVIFEPEKSRYANYLKDSRARLVKEVAGTEIFMQTIDP